MNWHLVISDIREIYTCSEMVLRQPYFKFMFGGFYAASDANAANLATIPNGSLGSLDNN